MILIKNNLAPVIVQTFYHRFSNSPTRIHLFTTRRCIYTQESLLASVERSLMELHQRPIFNRNWLHRALNCQLRMIESGVNKRLILDVHYGYHNCFLVSSAFTIWTLGRDSSKSILLVFGDDEECNISLSEIKQILNSDWYGSAFPDLRYSSIDDGEILTSADGGILATTVGHRLPERHFDHIVTIKTVGHYEGGLRGEESPDARWCVDELFSNSKINPAGSITVFNQRQGHRDLNKHLMEEQDHGWEHLRVTLIDCEPERILINNRNGGEWYRPDVDGSILPELSGGDSVDLYDGAMGGALYW